MINCVQLAIADLADKVASRTEKSRRLCDQAAIEAQPSLSCIQSCWRLPITHLALQCFEAFIRDVRRIGRDEVRRGVEAEFREWLEQVTFEELNPMSEIVALCVPLRDP